jgi:hypothetical protein
LTLVSISGALVLGQTLAGIVILVMYAGSNILEDFAVARAEPDALKMRFSPARYSSRRSNS